MAMSRAPLRDLEFVYYELFDGASIAGFPGFADATPDVVSALLEEIGKIASEVLHPLNAVGDEEGCRLENGAVRTPTGFRDAWAVLQEGGWVGVSGDRRTVLRGGAGRGLTEKPENGAQGMPHYVGVAPSEPMISANLAFSMY